MFMYVFVSNYSEEGKKGNSVIILENRETISDKTINYPGAAIQLSTAWGLKAGFVKQKP